MIEIVEKKHFLREKKSRTIKKRKNFFPRKLRPLRTICCFYYGKRVDKYFCLILLLHILYRNLHYIVGD